MSSQPSILLAVPTAGGVHEQTAATVAHLAARPASAYQVTLAFVRGRPHDYARNAAVRAFIRSPHSHLMFIDSDVEPPLDVIDRLLALDVPVATGCYPVGVGQVKWALCQKDDAGGYHCLSHLPSAEPFVVDACGAGCLLIRRDAATTLGWPWFKWVERADGYQMGEDVFFGRRCAERGVPIIAEPGVLCKHYKTIDLLSLTPECRRAKNQKHERTDDYGPTRSPAMG